MNHFDSCPSAFCGFCDFGGKTATSDFCIPLLELN